MTTMTSDRRLRTTRFAAAALAAVAGLLLSSCSGVPTKSSPSIVHVVDVGHRSVKLHGPSPGEPPRQIIEGFLNANVDSDPNHTIARLFLTKDASTGWQDKSLTVLDHIQIGNPRANRVVVQGREVGTINDTSNGAYTPALRGNGSGATVVRETFTLRRAHGQWRIGSLHNGLLISSGQFEASYQQVGIYFMDSTARHLAPDPRYVVNSGPQAELSWLVDNLVHGPLTSTQPGPANLLPSQTPAHPLVQLLDGGTQVRIGIGGAASLPGADRNRIAAEFGATLGQVSSTLTFEITDGGVPVVIPGVASAEFTADEVTPPFTVTATSSPPGLFYLYRHTVHDSAGAVVSGRMNDYGLISIALSPRPNSTVQIAGVRDEGKTQVLDVGTASRLFRTRVKGQLSRPAFAPDFDEAWVGDGSSLYRVSLPSRDVHTVALDVPRGRATGRIVAVRLSPEGSRVAIVLSANGTSQIWVGDVVRNGTNARVVNLAPISPEAVLIRDVAWNDQFKLFAIGVDRLTAGWGLWELQSDGSVWTERSNSGLPQAPRSLTVAAGSLAVVQAGDTLWQQQAGSWEPLFGENTYGTNPIYAE